MKFRSRARNSQSGYVLLMMLLFIAIMAITMATAIPALTTQIRREREVEMIHRGEQYARAVRRYYRKFGRYPSRIEELENTNNIRFLRKRYKDPMSPNGAWRVLHVGDVKIGMTSGATGNLNQVNPAQNTGGFGGQSAQGGFSNNSFGGNNSNPGNNATGATGAQFGTDTTSGGSTNAGSPAFGGQVFGGGPIIGVSSMVDKRGLHEFNNKPNYKDWYFIYDPSQDRGGLIKGPYNPNAFVGQGGNVGTPAGQLGNNPSPGNQSSFGNSGIGGGGGFGGGSTTPPNK